MPAAAWPGPCHWYLQLRGLLQLAQAVPQTVCSCSGQNKWQRSAWRLKHACCTSLGRSVPPRPSQHKPSRQSHLVKFFRFL